MTLLILLACSEQLGGLYATPFANSDEDSAVPLDDTDFVDTDQDLPPLGDDTSVVVDTGTAPVVDPCDGLGRGLCWVRSNPMVISGLVPSMGSPPQEVVGTYFGDFGANTAHLWATGLPHEVSAWRSLAGGDFRFIAWVQDDGTSASNGQVLGGVGPGAAGLVAYQVGDEPEDLAALAEMAVGVKAVQAADPDALIIGNFSVGKPEIEQMLDTFAQDMGGDILSYDRYSYGYAEYENMMTVREAGLRHGLPYWRYLRAFETKGAEAHWPEISDLRWQIYSGLTYGYTGHHWFVYQVGEQHLVESALFDENGVWSTPNERHAQVAELNRELMNVGSVITQLTSTDVRFLPATSVYVPEGHSLWSSGAGDDLYLRRVEAVDLWSWEFQDLVVGHFQDDAGERYLMVLNGNHAGADWPLWTHEQVTVELEFDFSNAPGDLQPDRMELMNAQTGTVHDHPVDNGVLRLDLLAGEAVLMKYATGAAWPG